MNAILAIYKKLYQLHGPQGWWPLTKNNSSLYHPQNYEIPTNQKDRFEICVGAILTQNTSWTNVTKSLAALAELNLLTPKNIQKISEVDLGTVIKSSGYYNQKAKKLKILADYCIHLKTRPTRDELLRLWGIGPETADSIMLYAWHEPTFVVDNYTRRFCTTLGLCPANASYETIKSLFESNLKPNHQLFNEYHALIVRHAKNHYTKKPYGEKCPIKAWYKQSTSR